MGNYELIQKAMMRMAYVDPKTFDDSVNLIIHESDGLLTKEAAAYSVMENEGFRMDSHVMGTRNSAVFTFLFSRITPEERSS